MIIVFLFLGNRIKNVHIISIVRPLLSTFFFISWKNAIRYCNLFTFLHHVSEDKKVRAYRIRPDKKIKH